ncbi:hypothetical protein D3C87_1088600 [compost metagenome]
MIKRLNTPFTALKFVASDSNVKALSLTTSRRAPLAITSANSSPSAASIRASAIGSISGWRERPAKTFPTSTNGPLLTNSSRRIRAAWLISAIPSSIFTTKCATDGRLGSSISRMILLNWSASRFSVNAR